MSYKSEDDFLPWWWSWYLITLVIIGLILLFVLPTNIDYVVNRLLNK